MLTSNSYLSPIKAHSSSLFSYSCTSGRDHPASQALSTFCQLHTSIIALIETKSATVNDKAMDTKHTEDPLVNKPAINDCAARDSVAGGPAFDNREAEKAATYGADVVKPALPGIFKVSAAHHTTADNDTLTQDATTDEALLTDLAFLSLTSTPSLTDSNVINPSESSPQSSTDSTTHVAQTRESVRRDRAVDIADRKLEGVLSDQMPELHITKRRDPFANLVCAFGFTGELEEPDPMPTSKAAFLINAQAELEKAVSIQKGLRSYYNEIETGRYHVFSAGFLEHEKAATITTCQQLDEIRAHIIEVIQEVNGLDDEDTELAEDLRIAYSHARPWIVRTRAILVNSHVFYKINYVLGSEKNF